ncbi:MAG: ABC transporter permease [Sphaerochaetaceae bacterium]
MNFDVNYLAVVFNSTVRMTTPILFVALGSALCNRVFIFNIGLEGMMLVGAFASIVANFYTGSLILSVLFAMLSSMLVAWIAGIFMVKFKGAMLVVGVSINVLISGLTTFLMQIVFGSKGAYVSTKLVSLTKIDVEFLKHTPILQTMFGSLTYLDLGAFLVAVVMNVFLFRTVTGFRLRSIGINKPAAESLGIKADRLQILTVVFSGLLSGLGGCLLTMGGVTMFAQNITAGRGFIAMAAGTLGAAHPLGVIASSAFFGFAQSMANMLQNTSISSQLTMALPYVATVVALAMYNFIQIKRGLIVRN